MWDPLIRIFHWSVAALFLANYWLLEGGEWFHEWAGYAVAGLIFARLVWGFIGPRNARFVSFWPTVSRLRHHLTQLRRRSFEDADEGHNPLGALMILLLMTLLTIIAVTGWMQGLDQFWGEDWVENLHEVGATILMIAVCIHVLAVLIMPRFTGIALIGPMITGKRYIIKSENVLTSTNNLQPPSGQSHVDRN